MVVPKPLTAALLAAGLLAGVAPPGLAAAPGTGDYGAGSNGTHVRIEDSPNDYLVTTTLRWTPAAGATSQEVCTRLDEARDTCQSGISPTAATYTAVTEAPAGAHLGFYVVTCTPDRCTTSNLVARTVP
ncbi:MAG TPA: hypothetical protein VFA92_17620 [Candidatus Binatia bacterium]|nr:hypothetical protein [Candidatus Binatia bacterium]